MIYDKQSNSSKSYGSRRDEVKRKAHLVAVCQICEQNYIIGVTGTVMGCDHCLNITRNPCDHSIIDDVKTGSPIWRRHE